ncbi:hypothetical protein AFLA_011548 [Aspergillus flavus NRRL3357]|uniref:NAD-dependent epimerase/dehydratase domain-containing protein n=1 Tax=Aspergillus flavus TaxID=5059 RepID=A0AB74BQP5_ASPFL|nr:hypothetical protein AFLA_011548 [Aspergillus flavus NRRL3357]RMZ36935.1 hypothetical protein CA14_006464 [Aspergillus flavus]
MAKVVLISGINGITGSAILDHLVKYTTQEEWRRIIITSHFPLTLVMQDPRVDFLALDFSKPVDVLAQDMSRLCTEVTHAHFSSYVHKDSFAELNVANRLLSKNFLDALLLVVRNCLQNCTLQMGGKYYNVHLQPVPTPAREDQLRLEDFLRERQRGTTWSRNLIRPEAIIGYAVKPNGMNEALTLALHFLACKKLGVEAGMPTN